MNLDETAAFVLKGNNTAALATASVKHEGFPFASQVAYALLQDAQGSSLKRETPIFLLSALSVHSKNLRKNSKASLLIQSGASVEQSRVSLMGNIQPLEDSAVDEARRSYLTQHPDAVTWVSFGDFKFYAMSIVDCYVVAGFGKAGWVRV